LDYIKHPLADYLHVFEEDDLIYTDERVHIVGLNYYDQVDRAFEAKARPAFNVAQGTRVFMLHGFISGYNDVPPYSSSLTLDQLAEVVPDFVFTGHYHRRCPPQRLPNGGWIITPGSLEMYDFGERGEKGFYIVDTGAGEPKFTWVTIEPKHVMKQVMVDPSRRKSPSWFSKRIEERVRSFLEDLRTTGKPGYLKIRLRGGLSEGFPSEINLTDVNGVVESDDHLLWVDVDAMNLELPPSMIRLEREHLDVAEFFSELGDFADDIRGMHVKVAEVLEEEASLQTGLLTRSRRIPLVEEWVKLLEGRSFRGEGA
jgi:DNA repair exonuclease SbcCD nuclease subunit